MEDLTKLLNIGYNHVRPERGKILISQPLLMDGCFRRSVVLLTDYSEKGATGIILNKRLPFTLENVMEAPPLEDFMLSFGGPVAAQTLHFLHNFAHIPDTLEIVNGVYWGGNMETVWQLLDMAIMKPGDIRFFLGYSGWTGGQLDEELKTNSWLVADIRASQILNPSRDLWQDAVKNMGEEYQRWMELPENPGMN